VTRFSPWPWAIGLGLLLVVLVNATFAYVAIRTAPQIEPSYEHAAVR
jgi:hypothetical protein